MQQHADNEKRNRWRNLRPPRAVCLCVLGTVMLSSLVLGAVTLRVLVPKAPIGVSGVSTRMGWYFHRGQLQADVRTLAAMMQFVASMDYDPAPLTNVANLRVAEARPGSPKS